MANVLIGTSKVIKNINKQIHKLSATPEDILIIGEAGTGKSVIANTIHTVSVRGNEKLPVVDLKLANIDEKELSAILFGYQERTPGLPETSRKDLAAIAEGGTILIEEADSASFRNQMHILHFLDKLVDLRDSSNKKPINIRIIVTIKDDPATLMRNNELLGELAKHLISFNKILIPPLRERKEDIPHLVEHFVVEACNKLGIQEPVIDINAISILVNQPWKNNVRELKAVIDRSVVFSSNGMFTLPPDLIDEKSKVTRMLETILTGEGQEINGPLDTIERGLINSALQRFNFDLSKTAQFLGMNQTTLQHRADQLGLRYERI